MRRITTIEFDGAGKRAIDNAKGRVVVTIVVFSLCFGVISARLIDLGLLSGMAQASTQGPADGGRTARADIIDRNGVLLATDLRTVSAYAKPSAIRHPEIAAARLASVLPGLSAADLEKKLRSSSSFVWVERKLTPAEHAAVIRLGIPGVDFRTEIERVYPHGNLAAHLIGYTNVDGVGKGGTERYFDARLKKDGAGGKPLQLAMDVRVQHVLRHEIQMAMEDFRALGGTGLIVDVNTGEIVAMASLPDFNPNEPGALIKKPAYMNRASHAVYEMGSTYKAFTMAMALEHNIADLEDGYDATNPIRVARFTINDDHPKARWLSMPEIFMYSSNIGSAKMALEAGGDLQQDFLRSLGQLDKPEVQLHEVGAPMTPTVWRDINTMTIAFGHGVAVSGLQLAAGFAAITNGGIKRPLTVLRADPAFPPGGTRVVSEATSRKMQALLRLVVEKGTGRKADAKGYLVGGKTGTAEKSGVGGYRRKALLSSFISVFPVTDPRYVVWVLMDEPKGNASTYGFSSGGWTAAPVVKRVIERAAPLLGVMPSDDETHPLVPAMLPLIQPELRS